MVVSSSANKAFGIGELKQRVQAFWFLADCTFKILPVIKAGEFCCAFSIRLGAQDTFSRRGMACGTTGKH